MGNWNINIQGVGCHHNGPDSKTDANNMAKRFVDDLMSAGHHIQAASFTHGAAEELCPATDPPAPPLGRDSRTGIVPPPSTPPPANRVFNESTQRPVGD